MEEANERLRELLDEPVSEPEVRIVLERFGQLEFGGPDVARVRDVAEASGADPELIAGILAEIRKDDFAIRFRSRPESVDQLVREHDESREAKHLAAEKEIRDMILPSDEETQALFSSTGNDMKREVLIWAAVVAIVFVSTIGLYILFHYRT